MPTLGSAVTQDLLRLPLPAKPKDDRPRLEATVIPNVFRLIGGRELGIDSRNLKGQVVSDGFLSQEDASAAGLKPADWTALANRVATGKSRMSTLVARFNKVPRAVETKVVAVPGGGEIVMAKSRLAQLEAALAPIRSDIEAAVARGFTVLYPAAAAAGAPYQAPAASSDPKAVAIDPNDYAALNLTAEENRWFFGSLVTKNVGVKLYDGRTHYMTPEMKKTCDDRCNELFAEVQAARAAGKRTVYMSTFISAGDPAVNKEIAIWIEKKMKSNDGYENGIYVLNPATREIMAGAKGDDYMYMWETLLTKNIFDAVRFTSAEDTESFFEAKAVPVPKEYLFTYGDVTFSAGCRHEWNFLAKIARDLGDSGMAHLVPQFFNGSDAIPMALVTTPVPTITYANRGEVHKG